MKRIKFSTSNKYFFIDDKDYGKVKGIKWLLHGKGYVRGYANGKKFYLHRFLLNIPSKMRGDHINGNPFDNRRSNLRIATAQQNAFNSRSRKTGGFKGVSYEKRLKKWIAYISHNYKKIHLGCFDTARLAAFAYDKKAVKLFGEFAKTNLGGK